MQPQRNMQILGVLEMKKKKKFNQISIEMISFLSIIFLFLLLGCFPNRDIMKLVNESGIHLLAKRTFSLGTNYFVIGQPTYPSTTNPTK